jgi:hypothetical protein
MAQSPETASTLLAVLILVMQKDKYRCCRDGRLEVWLVEPRASER